MLWISLSTYQNTVVHFKCINELSQNLLLCLLAETNIRMILRIVRA